MTAERVQSRVSRVASQARRGAAISLMIAGIALPLAYVRNWFFSEIDETKAIVGAFAVFSTVYVQGISTFLFPGGRNVMPAFFPKIDESERQAQFVAGYTYLVLGVALLGFIVTLVFPGVFEWILDKEVPVRTQWLMRLLIPLTLLPNLTTSILMGGMAFGWASLLLRSQLFFVSGMAVYVYCTGAPGFFANPEEWFAVVVGVSASVSLLVSVVILSRRIRWTWKPAFPSGVFRFGSFSYLDTVMVFAYATIDVIIINLWFGKESLGAYFLLFQITKMIPMAARELGHLILTTFSKLLGTDGGGEVAIAYRRVSRLTVGMYAVLSIVLIAFSRPISSIFGEACEVQHLWLLLLAIVMNVDATRTVNSMTLMAHERMPTVFCSKLGQNAIQLFLTLVLVAPLGIVGVIAAKGIGHVVNSVILFIGLGRLGETDRILPPRIMFVGQVVVVLTGVVAYWLDGPSLWISCAVVVGGFIALWIGGGYRLEELQSLVPWRRMRRASVA